MYTIFAIIAGFVADLLFGDPRKIPHPAVIIGSTAGMYEKKARRLFPSSHRGEFFAGLLPAVLLPLLSFAVCYTALFFLYKLHPVAGIAVEAFWCFQIISVKSLRTAALEVYLPLKSGNITEARKKLSYIVGRDTGSLDEAAIARATVETVAENTSDGSVAPLFYMLIGGAPLGMLYKAVNTMDSMFGYRNEQYEYFGKAAARIDDAANFLPARIAGLLMTAASGICGFDMRSSAEVFFRDRLKHKSPNSAHTEAACAGALGITLGGSSSYFGKIVEKPMIGNGRREITPEDILSANKLLYAVSFLALAAGTGIRVLVLLAAGLL